MSNFKLQMALKSDTNLKFPWPGADKTVAELKGDIANLSEQQQEMQFKADVLSLHADCMKVCRHFAEKTTNEKSRQIAQATWVRSQIHQGRCQVIEPYMQSHCFVKGGETVGALMDSWSKFVGDASAASALTGSVVKILFADCHKFARMSDDDLTALFDMMVRVSDADPKNFAGVVIVTTVASKKRLQGDLVKQT